MGSFLKGNPKASLLDLRNKLQCSHYNNRDTDTDNSMSSSLELSFAHYEILNSLQGLSSLRLTNACHCHLSHHFCDALAQNIECKCKHEEQTYQVSGLCESRDQSFAKQRSVEQLLQAKAWQIDRIANWAVWSKLDSRLRTKEAIDNIFHAFGEIWRRLKVEYQYTWVVNFCLFQILRFS